MLKSCLEMERTRVVVWGDRTKERQCWNYYLGDTLRLIVEVKDELPNGAFTFLYKNGVPAIKGFFERGDRTGHSEYFLPTGEVLNEEVERTLREQFSGSTAEHLSAATFH